MPDACRALALLVLLALNVCERVHRVSQIRAAPMAAMPERLHAFDDPAVLRHML